MSFYLTPKSPTAATSLYIGDTPEDARDTLMEMGYTMEQALGAALDGQALPSLVSEQDDIWTVEEVA